MRSREDFEQEFLSQYVEFVRFGSGEYMDDFLQYSWLGWQAGRKALDDDHEPLYIVLANEEPGHEWVFVEIETEDGRSVSAGEREPHSCGVRVGPFYTRPARADDEQE